jgi:hypothetical protein
VRLACVKHAASVRSEPGSNSQVHPKPLAPSRKQKARNKQTQPIRFFPSRHPPIPLTQNQQTTERKTSKAYCNASKRYGQQNTPNDQPSGSSQSQNPNNQPTIPSNDQPHSKPQNSTRTPPTYPFLAYSHLERTTRFRGPQRTGSVAGAAF